MLRLLQGLPWKGDACHVEEYAVVVDDSFAEAFNWNDLASDIPPEVEVRSLHDSCTTSFRHRRTVAFMSSLSMSSAAALKCTLSQNEGCEVHILTSVSEAGASAIISYTMSSQRNSATDYSGYDGLVAFLTPHKVTVTFFPLHSIKLLREETAGSLGVGVLSAQSSRSCKPISLSSLRALGSTREYANVAEVNASDLPGAMKASLKGLAHDLAGALLFDYGVDVSGSVHALGQTASILGYNVLPIVDELLEARRSKTSGTRLHAALTGHDLSSPLQAASLVIIDRTEDLVSPASAGGSGADASSTPLAHRIINTLNYCQYQHSRGVGMEVAQSERRDESFGTLSCDVSLGAPLLDSVSIEETLHRLGGAEAVDSPQNALAHSAQNWNKPMSALSALPLQLNPSLHLPHRRNGPSTEDSISHTLLSAPEEEAKTAIVRALKASIEAEKGVLPPAKKRGLGAEVLAYAQALILCPAAQAPHTSHGANAEEDAFLRECEAFRASIQGGLGYNYGACLRAQGLLSLSLAVIESMQRSSGKQFQQLCDWQCSYDVRTAREAELDSVARKFQDFDVCIAHLMSYFLPGNKAVLGSGDTSPATPGMGRPKGTAEKDLATAGPLDLVHILIQLIRLVSMFRQAPGALPGSSSNFGALLECICEYLLNRSCDAEVAYLCGLGFLAPHSAEDVRQYRAANAALDSLLCARFDAAGAAEDAAGAQDNEVQSKEAEIRQRQSSLRDVVSTAMTRLLELQGEYAAQKQGLLAGRNGDASAANRLLDLLPQQAEEEQLGVVARIARAYLAQRRLPGRGLADGLQQALEYIESPLDKMKRAGLGLLSKGFGSLFGGQAAATTVSTPHPAEQPVLVLFVLGGVSYKEVGQVQRLLQNSGLADSRVILLGTRILGAENVVYQLFN